MRTLKRYASVCRITPNSAIELGVKLYIKVFLIQEKICIYRYAACRLEERIFAVDRKITAVKLHVAVTTVGKVKKIAALEAKGETTYVDIQRLM